MRRHATRLVEIVFNEIALNELSFTTLKLHSKA